MRLCPGAKGQRHWSVLPSLSFWLPPGPHPPIAAVPDSLWRARHPLSLEWTFRNSSFSAHLWCTFQHHFWPYTDQHREPLAQGRQHLLWHSLPAAFPIGTCPQGPAYHLRRGFSCLASSNSPPRPLPWPCPSSHRIPRCPHVLRRRPYQPHTADNTKSKTQKPLWPGQC